MGLSDITAVIVTFKSEHKIFSCLDSIPDNLKVIIVENSNDINFKNRVESYKSNVKCFLLNENHGYAFANNFGLSRVKSKYGLVLNPDTRLTENTIKNFLNTALNFKDFWLIGPDQNFEKHQSKTEIIKAKTIKGYAMFFNLKKFNQKFFDENFFLYFEEIDLCRQVKLNHGIILIDKKIVVDHDGGSSVKADSQHELDKNRNWHWMWSTFYYHRKYKGFILALVFILPKLLSASLKTLIYFLLFNKKKRDVYYCRLSGLFNSILGNKSWYRPS